MTYRQFDIYWVDLEPTRGAETQKKRPCVIVQSDLLNQQSRTLLVAPILPGHKDWPFALNVQPTKRNGLDKPRHVNLKQIRVVDISRVSNKQGKLELHYLESFRHILAMIFSL